jgi:hypothetical protein
VNFKPDLNDKSACRYNRHFADGQGLRSERSFDSRESFSFFDDSRHRQFHRSRFSANPWMGNRQQAVPDRGTCGWDTHAAAVEIMPMVRGQRKYRNTNRIARHLVLLLSLNHLQCHGQVTSPHSSGLSFPVDAGPASTASHTTGHFLRFANQIEAEGFLQMPRQFELASGETKLGISNIFIDQGLDWIT